jgi:hypothetical protein
MYEIPLVGYTVELKRAGVCCAEPFAIECVD